MILQDLKDDLANQPHKGRRRFDEPALVVARRLADLYEECPVCDGKGSYWDSPFPDGPYAEDARIAYQCGEERGCSHCDKTGVVSSSRETLELDPYTLRILARHFFGEDT